MTYYMVETDRGGHCPETIKTFTNKKDAIKECREWRRWKDAVNGLRASERSRERCTECRYITTSDDFSDDMIHGKIF